VETLTLDSLVRRGYLHDHVIPPLGTTRLADALASLPLNPFDPSDEIWKKPKYSRCVQHSVPKRRLSRRVLAVPNPQHQIPLCHKLQECWTEIDSHCQKSNISLSAPTVRPNSPRAVGLSAYFRELSAERMVRSSGTRFHLYADFARFYGSIYTHSIAWALHGQEAARADEKTMLLSGNQIDRLVRNTQDRQSMGIPVGPDSSLILAEIIGCSIDQTLQGAGYARGIRYVDDFHLYFRSRGECEEAIASLHGASRLYELDINDSKTMIEDLPDVCEPSWKVALRSFPFGGAKRVDSDLLSYFNLAFELAKQHPSDGVLKYAVSKSAGVSFDDFRVYESALCRCVIAEPTCLPEALKIWHDNRISILMNPEAVKRTLEELCLYHAPLQYGFEVAWAIWAAIQLRIHISREAAMLISRVEDDSVALVALHAMEVGLMSPDPNLVWRSWLNKEPLNLEHWLAAYEFAIKGWVLPEGGEDYVGGHAFFSVLRDKSVSFYDNSSGSAVGMDPDSLL
jgi:hypothetical protein